MIFHSIKNSFEKVPVVFCFCCLLLWVPLIAGCSKYSAIKKKTIQIAHDIKTSDEDLKKRIGIVIFENRTLFTDQDFDELLQSHFTKTIKTECPDIIVFEKGDVGYPDNFIKLPRKLSGTVDNLPLIQTGRQLGLNAIVAGCLLGIRKYEEDRGILWFKDVHTFIRVQVMVEVYDTETGAKFLDESFSDEIEVEVMESELMEPKQEINIPAIRDSIGRMAAEMGESVCDAVGRQPWRGYIISAPEDTFIISSGEEVGLKPGDILEVYDTGKLVEGAQGQQFFIPGPKTGEIEITAVYPEKSEAVSVSGEGIKAGSLVRTKE